MSTLNAPAPLLDAPQNMHYNESHLYELRDLQQLRHFLFRKAGPVATPIPFPGSTFKSWVPRLLNACRVCICACERVCVCVCASL